MWWGLWWICGHFLQLVTARDLLNTFPCLRTPVPCGPHCSRERSAAEARNSPQSPLSLGFSHSLGLHHARETLHWCRGTVARWGSCALRRCRMLAEGRGSVFPWSIRQWNEASFLLRGHPAWFSGHSGDSVSYWMSFAIKFPFHLNELNWFCCLQLEVLTDTGHTPLSQHFNTGHDLAFWIGHLS